MYVSDRSIASLAATAAAAVFLFASTMLAANDVVAEPTPGSHAQLPGMTLLPEAALTQLPAIRAHAEPGDDITALNAVEIALTQASDGATYVWRRGNGRLSGSVRPTNTFRDADRRICRHIEMQLRLGDYTRRTEGIACRGHDGVWALEG